MYMKTAETLEDFKKIAHERIENLQSTLEKLEDMEQNRYEMSLMDRFEIRSLVQNLKLVYQGDKMSTNLFKMVFDKTIMETYFDCFKIASYCSLKHDIVPLIIIFDDFDKSALIQFQTTKERHKSEEWYKDRLHEINWLKNLRNTPIKNLIKKYKLQEDIFSKVYILREIAERKNEIKNPITKFQYRNKIRYALDKETNSHHIKKIRDEVKSYESESIERKKYLEETLNPIIDICKEKLEILGFDVEIEEINWRI